MKRIRVKSKKHLSTSASPEPLEFYLDESNDCDPLVEALVGAGHIVHRRKDNFPVGTDDVDWIPIVAEKRWVILTRDKSQRKNVSELNVIIISGARQFCLPRKGTGEKMAQITLDALPEIQRLVSRYEDAIVANIHESPNEKVEAKGKVTITVYHPTKKTKNKYAQFSKVDSVENQ
jgi:hypothetical protein